MFSSCGARGSRLDVAASAPSRSSRDRCGGARGRSLASRNISRGGKVGVLPPAPEAGDPVARLLYSGPETRRSFHSRVARLGDEAWAVLGRVTDGRQSPSRQATDDPGSAMQGQLRPTSCRRGEFRPAAAAWAGSRDARCSETSRESATKEPTPPARHSGFARPA